MRIRYAPTMVKDGLRVLAQPNQGRFLFDTRTEAQTQLDGILVANSSEELERFFGDVSKMRVDEFECYESGDAMHPLVEVE